MQNVLLKYSVREPVEHPWLHLWGWGCDRNFHGKWCTRRTTSRCLALSTFRVVELWCSGLQHLPAPSYYEIKLVFHPLMALICFQLKFTWWLHWALWCHRHWVRLLGQPRRKRPEQHRRRRNLESGKSYHPVRWSGRMPVREPTARTRPAVSVGVGQHRPGSAPNQSPPERIVHHNEAFFIIFLRGSSHGISLNFFKKIVPYILLDFLAKGLFSDN